MGASKKSDKKLDEVELVPDAWPRFEKFICEIVKAGPQHRDTSVKRGPKPGPAKKQTKVPPAKKPSKAKGR
jgi:hypothetical protein